MVNRLKSPEKLFDVACERRDGISSAFRLHSDFTRAAIDWHHAHGKSMHYTTPDLEQTATSYIALVNNEIAGIVMGNNKKPLFEAKWLAVHPKYRHGNILKSVVEALKNDFDEITLQAGSVEQQTITNEDGSRKLKTGADKGRRIRPLIKIYEEFGFKSIDPEWIPANMRWKRNETN